jgi:hypothetical protein
MLLGLAGVAIPIIIHLFNRRRFDVVDWGAMQFLQVSETTRRRLLLEELILLCLRMALIGLVVIALAAPYTTSRLFAETGPRDQRDVALVFDGSYSMGYTGTGRTAHDEARDWAANYVNGLAAGDSVAVLQAKQQVITIQELTHDLARVRDVLQSLPSPRGGCDWPQAVQAASKALEAGKRAQREIILLTDGQRFGWADDVALRRWRRLAEQMRGASGVAPRIWVVNVSPDRPADPPNWSLSPLRPSRAIASVGQQVAFHTALELRGQAEYQPPHRLRLEIDGQPVQTLKPPASGRLEKGQLPLSFRHRFTAPGAHLVSVIVEPDPPPEQRSAGYRIKDHLPGDNRQDFALEVVPVLPVLLVDGDSRPSPRHRGTDFLRDALAPARDQTPAVLARVVPVQEFVPALLTDNLGKEPGTKPRVLVLANVPRLTPQLQEAVTEFLAAGGGVLVTLGERVDALYYNEHLYRGGQGWLPARLDEVQGSETAPERAANPLPSSFFHPALELFRDTTAGGLADARFPRWWKVTTPGRGASAVPVALLSTNDPLFVERSFRGGRVLLSTLPLDNSGRTNLTDLPAFAPLAHELIYYLAGARSAEYNLQPGQPLRYRPDGEETPQALRLHPPEGPARSLIAERWPLVYEETREPGVYRLEKSNGQMVYYVVQSDPRESDLTPCADADRQKVAELVPMTYREFRERLVAEGTEAPPARELWWWFLFGVIGLLCCEVWFTRRLAQSR